MKNLELGEQEMLIADSESNLMSSLRPSLLASQATGTDLKLHNRAASDQTPIKNTQIEAPHHQRTGTPATLYPKSPTLSTKYKSPDWKREDQISRRSSNPLKEQLQKINAYNEMVNEPHPFL